MSASLPARADSRLIAPMLGFAIRNIAVSSSGRRVLLSAFESKVAIHDLVSGRTSETFETTFDAGGSRLALSDELDVVLAGAYHRHGIGAYSARSNEVLWRRADLRKVQTVRLSHDGAAAYCGLDAGPLVVLDVRTGETLRTVPGARAAYESPFDAVSLLEGKQPQIVDRAGKRLCSIPRESFATLGVAFAPGLVCISEAAGAVRAVRVRDGSEAWRYQPPPGSHVLQLGHDGERGLVSGVEWSFERGGSKRLESWRCSDGKVVSDHAIDQPSEQCFAMGGRLLVLADGRVLDVATAEQVAKIQ